MFLEISQNLQKTPMLESLCNKEVGPLPEFLLKKNNTDVFLRFLQNFSKHPFYRNLPGSGTSSGSSGL